ncbi:uncharacterized protein MYCGRDRAFT_93387 [Zymoseptoria tritici IPO323]|uniref:Uncharacterized protein n=1 Tax=Zymoseptoria tritici (strain CBS 115943 / IPO323) TaxID=336722 RepID=F9XBH6_ZYMTI|nr:uncharacterized protein MYCGRDRAFT_93387 [Zymoseptoria tritici IPO323]EGP87259.1 hypothetical protein MYCGRDRAFT_93387 [Zymoseptoria tritici IPO323]
MPPTRASKRRKLSPEAEVGSDTRTASPAPAPRSSGRRAAPTSAARKAKAKTVEAAPASPSPEPPKLIGRAIWKEAKAKKLSQKAEKGGRSLSRGLDTARDGEVFDDIDGALVGREPYGRMNGRAKQVTAKKVEEETPKGRVIPAKTGFFSRFSKEAIEAAEREGRTVGVLDSDDSEEEVFEDEDTDMDGMDDEPSEGEVATDSAKPNGSAKQSASGGKFWTTAPSGERKKTFEDEIRDLEAAAKRRAEEESSADELASENELRQSSLKKDTRTKRSARSKAEVKTEVTSVSKPRAVKPLDRRKATPTKAAATNGIPRVVPEDELEVGDSEDERVAAVSSKGANLSAQKMTTPSKARPAMAKKAVAIPSITFEAQHLQCIQRVLMGKATGKRVVPLTNLSDEYAKVYSLVDQTVTAGESNSMLLIGARGCGKTALVNQILREQSVKHPDDYHVVRLNGFIHTDDKIALREIWRQLGREMEMEEEDGPAKNYADTLSTLLALLSHPTEMGVDEPGQVTKSVIFIMVEFDLFATHPRQTLLYNLFDIAQSRKAPIAVLGLTTRIDVAESLEKRVKSRFSHRYVHLSLSKSLQAFEQVCRAALAITAHELSSEEKQELGEPTDVATKLQLASSKTKEHSAVSSWNSVVDHILASEPCARLLHRLYYTTKSILEFLTSLCLSIATIPTSESTTSTALFAHFTTTLPEALHAPDSKLTLLPSLSILQLALLISAARLTNIYNTEIISFNLAYDEYKNLASKAKLQASASGALAQGAGSRVWGKAVAKGAWEGLVECGLVMEDGRGGRVDVAMEEIGGSGVDLGAWGRWCREI